MKYVIAYRKTFHQMWQHFDKFIKTKHCRFIELSFRFVNTEKGNCEEEKADWSGTGVSSVSLPIPNPPINFNISSTYSVKVRVRYTYNTTSISKNNDILSQPSERTECYLALRSSSVVVCYSNLHVCRLRHTPSTPLHTHPL